MKILVFIAAAVVFGGSPAAAQPAAFEVASIKPAAGPVRDVMFCVGPCTMGERLSVSGSRVQIRFMSLQNLILTAYRIKPHQLSGPDWMQSQKFDIDATFPTGASKDTLPEMLQQLLAARFKLSVHHDRKEQPVYALVVAKDAPRLKTSAANPEAAQTGATIYTPQGDAFQLQDGTVVIASGPYGPVRGGKKGAPSDGDIPETGRPPDPFGEGLFAALRTAGLKLASAKAPVEVIVVDHVEKSPSGN